MTRKARTRALITCFSLAGCFTAFSARLVHLQVTMHEEYASRAQETHSNRQAFYARRGTIQDVHGESLAQNEPIKTVVADATLIKNPAALAALLAGPLKMEKSAVLEKLSRQVFSQTKKQNVPAPYIVLKKEVPETLANEIAANLAAHKLRGIAFEQDSTRIYPNGEMLCHVIGFTNREGAGIDGIERTMDEFLRGHDGFRYSERDRTGREIVPYRGLEKSASNGCNVRLTIDMGLQNIVETELDEAIRQFKPKSATVILMNPKTGEILALANRPNFNLNQQEGVAEDFRRNRAISDQVEPGSTFKIVTTAAALTERVVQPDTYIFCENGYMASCRLHDHRPYGDLTVSDALVKSSNIAMAKLAIRLGEQRFHDYVKKFGFGERTGVDLPGEIAGVVHPTHTWSKISITRIPMGQEVSATPLQITAAMCAIANGGHLMMPQIIHEITDDGGVVKRQFPPQEVRRVASKEATEQVRDALVDVVSAKGTAALAHVAGFKVAGKTGTAQKTVDGHYDHEKYVVSFVGYMPAEDPAFVGLVLMDEAKTKHGENYGGLVAAPVFSRIAEKAARYLGLTPAVEEPLGNIVAGSGNFRDQ